MRRRRGCGGAVRGLTRVIAIVLVNLPLDVIHELPVVLLLAKVLQIIIGIRWISVVSQVATTTAAAAGH